ncbi:MAG: endonuclease MutS2 [Bacillota bacterium]
MDPKTLEHLEFRKIQEMLAREADTPLGRERAHQSAPGSVPLARDKQRLGREIMDVLARTSSPSLRGVTDVRLKVTAASQGVVLSGEDLRGVLDVLQGFETLHAWLSAVAGPHHELARVRERIPRLTQLGAHLARIVDESGAIKDTASPRLASVRRQLRDYQERMRKRAEEITRRKDIAQYLQEPIVTLRNGRYVVPVKQENAPRVPGLVHDQSASGQTLFVEPQELLEMANNLRRLELMERDEIERILAEASSAVGESASLITGGVAALSDFDLGLAEARLAFKWRGSFPTLSEEHVLRLSRAWHPLLKGTPIPMDISLEEGGIRTVVITGPNMGGKTVALKTCGLLSAMALSGLPCPCSEKSVVGEIDDVLCDIGDEQSIEESLSTFSAHISNVVRILKVAGPGKLILIDELGAGTDPQEGAALALAILKRLNLSGALSVITSHFSELKVAAQQNPGMQNASVEWDAVNLVPTYRLVVGRPGRSNAFLVAKKLGLGEDVLSDARSSMHEELLHLEDIIQEMEESSQRSAEAAALAERDRRAALDMRAEVEGKAVQMESTRKEILNEAKREAALIINRARVELEKAVREFREVDRKNKASYAGSVNRMRESINAVRDEVQPEEQFDQGAPLSPDQAVSGTTVSVLGFASPGTVIDEPDSGGMVMIRIGALSLRTALSSLRAVKPAAGSASQEKPERREAEIPLEKAKEVSLELDLRGMTSDEAFDAVDKHLDDAVLASLPQVRIIHGKGTGALRKAVSDYLRKDPRVADFRLGETGEGGSGVTVATLRAE